MVCHSGLGLAMVNLTTNFEVFTPQITKQFKRLLNVSASSIRVVQWWCGLGIGLANQGVVGSNSGRGIAA